ncbi:MAG: WhiB family transcriptional regulator [Ilumatobacteraceae bacterium]
MNQRIEATEGDDRAWQDQANCLGVDPDLFFPERGASTREAKEVCRGCEVRQQCLERRRLRRQRAQANRSSITA